MKTFQIVLLYSLASCVTTQSRFVSGACFEISPPEAPSIAFKGRIISCNEQKCKTIVTLPTLLSELLTQRTLTVDLSREDLENEPNLKMVQCPASSDL